MERFLARKAETPAGGPDFFSEFFKLSGSDFQIFDVQKNIFCSIIHSLTLFGKSCFLTLKRKFIKNRKHLIHNLRCYTNFNFIRTW